MSGGDVLLHQRQPGRPRGGYVRGMRVAALYDIHGNIAALDAVLHEIGDEAVDVIVIGGDIAWGAFPAAAIDRVQSLGQRALFIRGNADRELVEPIETNDLSWIDEVTTWCQEQLTESQTTFLTRLPLTQTVDTGGSGEVLFCHATPGSDDEIFTAITPEEEVAAMLAGVKQKLVVCGHTHTQFDRRIGDHRVVNAGSVGMPYEDAPGAYWAIVGDEVELRRTDYDFEAAAKHIRKSHCPHVEGFANAVTSPLKRDAAISRFERGRDQ